MKLNQQQVQHLLLRAGFGDNFETVNSYVGWTPEQILKNQFELSKNNREVKIDTEYSSPFGMKEMSQAERQQMRKKGRNEVKSLNILWLKEMARSPGSLNEKMAFFWHDHFACKSQNSIFMQGYLNAIRGNALGNFGDLLRAVSKQPAMLQYLNNQQNKKQAPNENFAREVMELFTMGRDQGYTELDISEAARAFTGWGFNKEGTFVSRTKQHDSKSKTIFGKTGQFNGDDVLDILLDNKQTAKYISQKWVQYFVNSEGNSTLEKRVADALYQSNYDIKSGLMALFSSSEFFETKNIGIRIKSPIELIVNFQRQLRVNIEDKNSLLFLQRMMGQVLFDPPNVAGWPDGKEWVDSASLMFRLNLPQLIFKSAIIQNHPDKSFDDNDQFRLTHKLKKLQTNIDVEGLEKPFKSEPAEVLGNFLIQGKSYDINTLPESFIDQVIYFTSKPEYQLC